MPDFFCFKPSPNSDPGRSKPKDFDAYINTIKLHIALGETQG